MLKTLRDIRETIGSFISIIVVIIIGCFFFAGIIAATTAVTDRVNRYYDACSYPSYRAEYFLVNSAAVDEIGAQRGVTAAAGYNSFYTPAAINGKTYDMALSTLTKGIDEPYMLKGEYPAPGTIVVDSVFADAHSVGIGDTVIFNVPSIKSVQISTAGNDRGYVVTTEPMHRELTVCGIFHSPDIFHKFDIHNIATEPENFIVAFVLPQDAPLIADGAAVLGPDGSPLLDLSTISAGLYNAVRVVTSGEINAERIFGKYTVDPSGLAAMLAQPTAPAGLYSYSMERSDFPSIQMFDTINNTISALAAILPVMFFLVAVAITVISMSKTVDSQRSQIGVIQALGVSKSSVYFSYIFYALFASVIGATIGGIIGHFTVPILVNYLYSRQFSMPPIAQHVNPLYLFLGIILAAALACLSAFLSCYKTLRVKPAQAMRPKPPKKTKRILIERWTGLWKRLGFGAKMNLRNMFLHKTRMVLSSVGIIGCLAILIGLIGLKDNMMFTFDMFRASSDYDIEVTINDPVNIDMLDFNALGAEELAGKVDRYTFTPSFSGRFSHNGVMEDIAVVALPTAQQAQSYSHADADCIKIFTDSAGKSRLTITDDTFAIPTGLADTLGVSAGDTVDITGLTQGGEPIAFSARITHVITEYFEQTVYCSYGYFKNRGIALWSDTLYVRVSSGESANVVASMIHDHPKVRNARPFSEHYDTLKRRNSMLDAAVLLFALGAGVLAVAVIYNITATNLKERTREIATLMVLGYKHRETANMLIAENMVITALGCAIGLPLGYALLCWLSDLACSFGVYVTSFLSWYVAIGCIGLTFVFSLLATLMFNRKLKKISMVESLKSVE